MALDLELHYRDAVRTFWWRWNKKVKTDSRLQSLSPEDCLQDYLLTLVTYQQRDPSATPRRFLSVRRARFAAPRLCAA